MLGSRFDNKVSNFIGPNEVFCVPGGLFLRIKQKSFGATHEGLRDVTVYTECIVCPSLT